MFDKRTTRLRHAAAFEAAFPELNAALPTGDTDRLLHGVAAFVRVRPFTHADSAKREFPVAEVPSQGGRVAALHLCLTGADLKALHVRTLVLTTATAAWGGAASEGDVAATLAGPLAEAASAGRPALLLLLGQTGAGKTHTCCSVEAWLAQRLLGGAEGAPRPLLNAQYIEVAGRGVRCLVTGADVALRDIPGGGPSCVLEGAAVVRVADAQGLLTLLAAGRTLRATAATAANAGSSRSHAVLRLSLPSGGVLLLLDCAGSERNADSFAHDAALRASGAAINASLHALRNCCAARARAAFAAEGHVHVPYRSTPLTRVLAEALAARHACIHVLAALSPCASDAEHSASTLSELGQLTGAALSDTRAPLARASPARRTPPVQWSPSALRAWLGEAEGGAFAGCLDRLPPSLAGRDVARMTSDALGRLLGEGLGPGLHAALRREVAAATVRAR